MPAASYHKLPKGINFISKVGPTLFILFHYPIVNKTLDTGLFGNLYVLIYTKINQNAYSTSLLLQDVYTIVIVEELVTVRTGDDDDDDDDLSTGAVVAITAVVTFITTLVITVPVTTIISIMCYKHRCEQREKSNNKNDSTQDYSQFVLTDRDVKMDTNPSYAIMDKETIKMDTNPAYAVTK